MVKRKLIEIISSWFYTGYSPVAPGTCGTAGAVVFYLVFLRELDGITYSLTGVIFIIFAIYVSSYISEVRGDKDPPDIVVDEVAGYIVTMSFVPFELRYVITGFVLFRIFDVVKPFPVRKLEGLSGGYGIVLDDVAAGVWSNMILHIIYLYIY